MKPNHIILQYLNIIFQAAGVAAQACQAVAVSSHNRGGGSDDEEATQEDGEEWPLAEILSIRHLQDGSKQYYVHFIEYNKRLDEWVTEDRLNFSHIEPPKPKDQDKTNVNTPKRSISASAASSRPSTPPATTESGIFFSTFMMMLSNMIVLDHELF